MILSVVSIAAAKIAFSIHAWLWICNHSLPQGSIIAICSPWGYTWNPFRSWFRMSEITCFEQDFVASQQYHYSKLHWLPISFWEEFKMVILIYKALRGLGSETPPLTFQRNPSCSLWRPSNWSLFSIKEKELLLKCSPCRPWLCNLLFLLVWNSQLIFSSYKTDQMWRTREMSVLYVWIR